MNENVKDHVLVGSCWVRERGLPQTTEELETFEKYVRIDERISESLKRGHAHIDSILQHLRPILESWESPT